MRGLLTKYRNLIPRGIGGLFLIQMITIFAFSILYSTLVLYITHSLQLNDSLSTSIVAAFFAINYVLHLLGGYIGGRWMSNRCLLFIGLCFQMIGCSLIAFPGMNTLFWGLSSFVMGTGLSTTCISCMITQIYEPNDKRRETAFILNYSGFNIFYLIGFSVSGYFQLMHAYHTLFLLGSLSSFSALLVLAVNWKLLRDNNSKLNTMNTNARWLANIKGAALMTGLILIVRVLFQHANFANQLVMFVAASVGVLLMFAALKESREVGNKIWAYLIFAIASLIFLTLYQLAPMGLTLFIQRNVDLHLAGWVIAPQWVKNINSIVVIIGGPLLSYIFTRLRERGIAITIPFQFAVALILIGVSFVMLPIGIHFANAQGYSNINWLLWSYVVQTIGELFMMPIGYAMIGQLAPANLQGLMMGAWLMITGVATTLGWYFSSFTLGVTTSVDPLVTNPAYSYTFNLLGGMAIAAGIVMTLLMPYMQRLTQENQQTGLDQDLLAEVNRA